MSDVTFTPGCPRDWSLSARGRPREQDPRARHGIRVTHDGKTADFVICFECFQVMVYVAGEKEQRFLITDSPASVFNQTLQNSNIPLARESEKKK